VFGTNVLPFIDCGPDACAAEGLADGSAGLRYKHASIYRFSLTRGLETCRHVPSLEEVFRIRKGFVVEGEEAEMWFGDANGGNVSAGLLPEQVRNNRKTRYKYASIYREFDMCIFRHVRGFFSGLCVPLTVAHRAASGAISGNIAMVFWGESWPDPCAFGRRSSSSCVISGCPKATSQKRA
jgi:hypothetical protein